MQKSLTPTDIKLLELEFGYIQTTISQTIDDRYKLLSFYIGIGSTVATVLVGFITLSGAQTDIRAMIAVAGLSLVMWIVGLLFTLMFVRLRQAWVSGVLAINQIKQHLAAHSETEVNSALRWQTHTMPAAAMWWNIHFYSVVIINIISGIFLSIFSTLTTLYILEETGTILIAIVAFSANMGMGVSLYIEMLKQTDRHRKSD